MQELNIADSIPSLLIPDGQSGEKLKMTNQYNNVFLCLTVNS